MDKSEPKSLDYCRGYGDGYRAAEEERRPYLAALYRSLELCPDTRTLRKIESALRRAKEARDGQTVGASAAPVDS